jgi:hypothetical protein
LDGFEFPGSAWFDLDALRAARPRLVAPAVPLLFGAAVAGVELCGVPLVAAL